MSMKVGTVRDKGISLSERLVEVADSLNIDVRYISSGQNYPEGMTEIDLEVEKGFGSGSPADRYCPLLNGSNIIGRDEVNGWEVFLKLTKHGDLYRTHLIAQMDAPNDGDRARRYVTGYIDCRKSPTDCTSEYDFFMRILSRLREAPEDVVKRDMEMAARLFPPLQHTGSLNAHVIKFLKGSDRTPGMMDFIPKIFDGYKSSTSGPEAGYGR